MEAVKEVTDCLKEDPPLPWWGLRTAILTHTPAEKKPLIPKGA